MNEVFTNLRNNAKKLRQEDPELSCILSKSEPFIEGVNPERVLDKHGLLGVSSDFRKFLDISRAVIDPSCVKDGFAYLFRGDYPGLEKKGIYSFEFYRFNINLDKMLSLLNDEPLSHRSCHVDNKLEQLMWQHALGGHNFLSATTDFEVARLHPGFVKNNGMVYVLKVPLNKVFNNYCSTNVGGEREIVIVDYVLPKEILKVINPNKEFYVNIKEFMH